MNEKSLILIVVLLGLLWFAFFGVAVDAITRGDVYTTIFASFICLAMLCGGVYFLVKSF